MSAAQCEVRYVRPSGESVRCTYLADHPRLTHSFETMRLQDEADAVKGGQYATQVGALLEAIACGDLDPYLEAILAGAHGRKRARRGIWTPGEGS